MASFTDAESSSMRFERVKGDSHMAHSLLEFTQTRGVDLLSLTNSNEDLLSTIAGRSLTTEFVFESEIPLLVFPL